MSKSIATRQQLLETLQQELRDESISLGAAVRRLRTQVTGLRQEQFAKMCKISLSALRQLEYDAGNPTLRTLKAVFEPFGMTVGIVPRQRTPAAPATGSPHGDS